MKKQVPPWTAVERKTASGNYGYRTGIYAFVFLSAILAACSSAFAQSDLWMADTPQDTGIEPNPDQGPMWISQDIWVRKQNDGLVNQFHENPEYRDPLYGNPNYVYIKIRNRGNQPSAGTEELRVYWTLASSGLLWPVHWVDYVPNPTPPGCTQKLLFGDEITHPPLRQNIAHVSQAERNRLIDAIVAIDASPFLFPDGISYWDKQDQIHQATHVHGGPSFTPWHRELINRYELRLREYDPLVSLHYWDWTTDPRASDDGQGGTVDLFTSSFMGSPSGRAGAPLGSFDNNNVFTGSRDDTGDPADPPMVITRNVNGGFPGAPSVASDNTIVTTGNGFPQNQQWQQFRQTLESNHGGIHGYIGGTIGSAHSSFEDPFVFLLHSNVDRLFALWQTDPNYPYRLDPVQVYGNESNTTGSTGIATNQEPWSGGSLMRPWTSPDNQEIVKDCKHSSIVLPPWYDTNQDEYRVLIPVLQPGQQVILEIPWYPQDPNKLTCFNANKAHVCLIARIENVPTSPFGMTFPEQVNVRPDNNVRNNNNIVWKNVTIEDLQAGGLMKTKCVVGRNVAMSTASTRFIFTAPSQEIDNSFWDHGTVVVDLGDELYQAWMAGGFSGQYVTPVEGTEVLLQSPGAWVGNIDMAPEEMHSLCLEFTPPMTAEATQTFTIDMFQFDEDAQETIGGERFSITVEAPEAKRDGDEAEAGVEAAQAWVRIYPNPASDRLNIVPREQEGRMEARLYDLSGRLVKHVTIEGSGTMSLTGLPEGAYFLKVLDMSSGREYIDKVSIR